MTTDNTVPRTFYYFRVSTAGQESDSEIGHQRRRCAIVSEMLDFEPMGATNVFIDHGVSGGTRLVVRPQGQALWFAMQKEERGCNLIAYDLFRLFRDVDDGREMMRAFDRELVRLYLANEGGNTINVSSAMGRFLLTVRLAQAEFERGITSERTKAGLETVRARGGKIGEAPYGWDNVGEGKHAPNLGEQFIVKMILDFDVCGDSAREVARKLNAAGYLTREGAEWTHVQVGRILQREEER